MEAETEIEGVLVEYYERRRLPTDNCLLLLPFAFINNLFHWKLIGNNYIPNLGSAYNRVEEFTQATPQRRARQAQIFFTEGGQNRKEIVTYP